MCEQCFAPPPPGPLSKLNVALHLCTCSIKRSLIIAQYTLLVEMQTDAKLIIIAPQNVHYVRILNGIALMLFWLSTQSIIINYLNIYEMVDLQMAKISKLNNNKKFSKACTIWYNIPENFKCYN